MTKIVDSIRPGRATIRRGSHQSFGLGVRRKARWLGYILTVTTTILSLEIGSYVFYNRFVPNFLLFSAPQVDRPTFETYRATRDPVLGWPTEAALSTDLYDASGSRPIPAFPAPGSECVTLYGDSFVYSEEVSDAEAWGNVLASRLGCRVGNFGVSAYGTDQAYLRFEGNLSDRAPITILGIFPHDLLRNITQYFYLLNMTSSLAFKPRFIVEGGDLRLVPLPDLTYQQLQTLEDNFEEVLPREDLMPGNGLGPVLNEFPYTLTIWNVLTHERVRNWIWGLPSWQSAMKMDHESQALLITFGIVRKFVKQCRLRDKYCVVLLFPTQSSYKLYAESGLDVWSDLTDEFVKHSIFYLNLTMYFSSNLTGRSYCEILVKPASCDGHLNAEGNAMVARAVEEHIRTRESARARRNGAVETGMGQLRAI